MLTSNSQYLARNLPRATRARRVRRVVISLVALLQLGLLGFNASQGSSSNVSAQNPLGGLLGSLLSPRSTPSASASSAQPASNSTLDLTKLLRGSPTTTTPTTSAPTTTIPATTTTTAPATSGTVGPLPSDAFGFNASTTFSSVDSFAPFDDPARQSRRAQFAQLVNDNATTLRLTFAWNDLEEYQGNPKWWQMDPYIEDASAAGLRILPLITGTPAWAAKVSGSPAISAPKDPSQSGQFAAQIVQRYGRGGYFWSTYRSNHPNLPVMEARVYEVWNEENHEGNWCSTPFMACHPNPTEYANLFASTRSWVRSVDSAAVVIVGGLVEMGPDNTAQCSSGTCSPTNFLSGMYANGALRGAVDGVGIHAYPQSRAMYPDAVSSPVASMARLRTAMKNLGDPNVPFYITEIGWNTSANGGMPVFTESERQQGIDGAAERILRSNCNVKLFMYSSYDYPQDSPNSPKYPDGLRATPSEDTWRSTTARLENTSGPRNTSC